MKYKFAVIFLFLNIFPVFSENLMKNIGDKIPLGSFFILESEISEGRYVKDSIGDFPFVPYDGRQLPKKLEIKNRMYTLRAGFYIDENVKNENLSLYIGTAEYPYHVYINGVLLFTQGRHGDGVYNSSSIYSENLYLPKEIIRPGNERNEIAFELFPQFEQNPLMEVVLSGFYENSAYVFWRNLFGIHFVQASVIVALLISLYFIFMLLSRKNKDMKYIYFSLIGITFFFGYINITFLNESADELIFTKLARSGQTLAAALFACFAVEFTGILNRRPVKIALLTVVLAASIAFFLQSSKEQIQNAFNLLNKLTIAPMLILILIIAFIALARNRTIYNIMILLGISAIVITGIRDIIYLGSSVVPYCWLLPYGFLFLILDIFFLLALEQSAVYLNAEERSLKLNERNESVTSIISRIGIVSDDLSKSGNELEANIESLLKTFKDYETTNKGIVDKILAEFDNIEMLINKISNRIDSSADRIPKAILSQTAVVEETSATLLNMNKNIDSIMDYVLKTNEVSKKLSELASQSSDVIIKSKNSIDEISGHSQFISSVLTIIEDIADKTNLLSINASIESARAGNTGRGFAVVAHEIRELAQKSKNSLTTSFSKIKEMHSLINNSTSLSEEVANTLFEIIDKSKESFGMMELITGLFREQKTESDSIIEGTKSLLSDTLLIKELSDEENAENLQIKQSLSRFSGSFHMIAGLLKTQIENEKNIHGVIENINSVLSNNMKNVGILNETMNLKK